MKKLFQVLFSLFFATSMSFPVDALASTCEDRFDVNDEQSAMASESEDYQMTLVAGNFGLQRPLQGKSSHSGSPMLFIREPAGRIVANAQVITTIIGSDGEQLMNRACPFRGGYLVFTNHLLPGQYRIEAEVVTNGSLLTKNFSFINT